MAKTIIGVVDRVEGQSVLLMIEGLGKIAAFIRGAREGYVYTTKNYGRSWSRSKTIEARYRRAAQQARAGLKVGPPGNITIGAPTDPNTYIARPVPL